MRILFKRLKYIQFEGSKGHLIKKSNFNFLKKQFYKEKKLFFFRFYLSLDRNINVWLPLT